MSTFTVGKSQHNKNDAKNASLAMKSRQQVINEVNKRRTLLQDNSWIKKRPEEEGTNENYGRVVLNQYKSQENLHRNMEAEDDDKAILNRYRSDTTLDRHQDIDDFIKVNRTSKWEEKCHDLDSLIEVKDNNSKEGNKDLDDFIIVNCTYEPCDRRSQDLNNLIKVNHMSNQLRKDGYRDVEDLIEVNRISNQKGRCSDLDSFIEVQDKNNQRAIIDKELCTYCRKPLGTETKMILEALKICCHATCFKCEICNATLENLEAGDSIWIYKNIVHCSPCYSNVKARWTY